VRDERALHQTEMGKVEFRWIQFPDFGNRFVPGFDVQLRRNKRRNRRSVPEADTGDITAEEIISPTVNMMMTGMPRRGDGADFKRGHRHNCFVFQNCDAVFRDWRDSAPQSLHFVTVDPGSGCDQLRGINQMLSAAGMDVNRRSKLGQSPGCAGMIEMNVTEKDMPDVVSRSTNLPKRSYDIIKARLGPGIKQDDAIVCFQRGCGNDARPAELKGIENVNFQRRLKVDGSWLVGNSVNAVKSLKPYPRSSKC
jgi:hypothetical protein